MRHVALLTASLVFTACANNDTDVSTDNDAVSGNDVTANDCPVISSENWTAWIDAEPPGPAQLHIRGEADLPTPGYSASWRVGIADRAMPPGQHMHVSFAPPDGMVTQVVTRQDVEYAGPAEYPAYRVIYVHCGDQRLAEITDIPVAH